MSPILATLTETLIIKWDKEELIGKTLYWTSHFIKPSHACVFFEPIHILFRRRNIVLFIFQDRVWFYKATCQDRSGDIPTSLWSGTLLHFSRNRNENISERALAGTIFAYLLKFTKKWATRLRNIIVISHYFKWYSKAQTSLRNFSIINVWKLDHDNFVFLVARNISLDLISN